mmetsp:Transcript_10795/g.19063  ORF Transcript_10795/g.19063 Transcript_10795/m.19063 type:complete len:448 (+) Transcript_10795:153-1496(+)
MLIPRVSLATSTDAAALQSLVEKVGRCGPVVLVPSSEIASSNADEAAAVAAVEKVAPILRANSCRVGPLPASNVGAVTEWLNGGASRALVIGSLEEIAQVGAELPKERLIACLSTVEGLTEEDLALLEKSVGSVVVEVPSTSSDDDIRALAETAYEKLGKVFRQGLSLHVSEASAGTCEESCKLVGDLHHLKGSDHPIHVESSIVSVPKEDSTSAPESGFDVGLALNACLRTDREDGLYTTVVTDELGVALGLVYSSKDSLRRSIAEGRGIYWSRSRNSLWRKGDSSGAIQLLVSIDFDCDADAVRFQVKQLGSPAAFCHQGWRGCWGEDSGVPHLYRTLETRKNEAPEGSYTKRLFEDKTLLRNKLLEEAQEVIEAVEENDPVHVAEEVADLTYFMLTACVSGNATLHDVYKVLDERSRKVKRRPGNAKAYRIAEAERTLAEKTSK